MILKREIEDDCHFGSSGVGRHSVNLVIDGGTFAPTLLGDAQIVNT